MTQFLLQSAVSEMRKRLAQAPTPTLDQQDEPDRDAAVARVMSTLVGHEPFVTNTLGLGERAVVASEAAELEEMQSGKKAKTLVPDFTLYAKLIQQTDRNSKLTQNTYSFQMSLVQVKTGLTVWEDEKQITKQTKAKPALGW